MKDRKSEKISVGYVTCSSAVEARTIAKILVKSRKVACVVNIPIVRSNYIWKGKIEEAKESVLLIKTFHRNIKIVSTMVKAHHSYVVPCILWIDVQAANAAYAKWMKSVLAHTNPKL